MQAPRLQSAANTEQEKDDTLRLDISKLTQDAFNTALQKLVMEKPDKPVLVFSCLYVYKRFVPHEASFLYLRQIVETSFSLVKLFIIHISLGNVGASILAEGLKSNHKLQLLTLSQTNIMKAGGLSLANALKSMHSLVDLNLNHNEELGGHACIEIMKSCQHLPNLTKLSLSYTGVFPKEAEIMLVLLAENNRIHNFLLDSTHLHDTLIRKNILITTARHAFMHKYVNKELPLIFWTLAQIPGLHKDVTIPVMHYLRLLRYSHPPNFPIPNPVKKGRNDTGITLVYQDNIDAAYVHSQVTLWEYCYILHLCENTIQIMYANTTQNQGIWIKPQKGLVVNCYNLDYARKMQQLFFSDCAEVKVGTRKIGKNNLLINKLGLFASQETDATAPYRLKNLLITSVKSLAANQAGYEIRGQSNGDMHSIIIFDMGVVISGTGFTDDLNSLEQRMYDNWDNIKQHFGIVPECRPRF